MGKLTTTRRRGISRGVQRAVVGTKRTEGRTPENSIISKKLQRLNLAEETTYAFKLLVFYCAKLYLIPFEELAMENNYALRPRKARLLFYLQSAFACCLGLVRTLVTANLLLRNGVNILSCLCMGQTLVSLSAWLVSVGVIHGNNTIDLLNCRQELLTCFRLKLNLEWAVCNDVIMCAKVLTIIGLVPICGVMSALLTTIVTLPTSWLSLAESLGFDGTSIMKHIWWEIIFFALELASAFSTLMTAAVCASICFMELSFARVAATEIRNIPVVEMESRRNVQLMYTCYQIYGNVVRHWTKLASAPIILAISLAIVVAIFVGFKHTQLPWFVDFFCCISSIAFPILLFIALYEGVQVGLISQSIISDQLMCFEVDRLQFLPTYTKLALIKRAKAFRAVTIPSGEFTEITFTLIWSILEEIISQIVFLFSL